MSSGNSLVIVIDDDVSVRRGLARLLESEGYAVEVHASASDYLDRTARNGAACLVLDVKMPGLNGLELQERMVANGWDHAIVFITGHGDVPMSVRAMKAGAVDFLLKPFTSEALLSAVAKAVERAAINRRERAARNDALARLERLTPREMEVFRLIVAGMQNKQIAAKLGTAEKTVKNQRAHIVAQLGLGSVADMVRLALEAGILPPRR